MAAAGLGNEVALEVLGDRPTPGDLRAAFGYEEEPGWPVLSHSRLPMSPSWVALVVPEEAWLHHRNEELSVRLCLATLNSTRPLWWEPGHELFEPEPGMYSDDFGPGAYVDPDATRISTVHPSTMVEWVERWLTRRRSPDETGFVTFEPFDWENSTRLREDADDFADAFDMLVLNSGEVYSEIDWEADVCLCAAALGRLLSAINVGGGYQTRMVGLETRCPRDREIRTCMQGALLAWTAKENEGGYVHSSDVVDHPSADPHVYGHLAVELGGWLIYG